MYNISVVLIDKHEDIIDDFFLDSCPTLDGAEAEATKYIKGKKDPRIDDMINVSGPGDMIEVWIQHDDDPSAYYLAGRIK